ncbi:Uncharacterised protein [uncultured archaeon]|nr:Uncharacterised protein [uncultured archaeon]
MFIHAEKQAKSSVEPDGFALQRKCDKCHKKKSLPERLYIRPALASVPPMQRSPGQPLDAATRAFMEPRLGHDFGQVRVHNDTQAEQSAEAINALAYTIGRDIVFGSGQYSPGTDAGRRLLAHELAHVMQQNYLNNAADGVIQRSATIMHRSSVNSRPDLIRFEMDRPTSLEALIAQIRSDLAMALHTAVWMPIVGQIDSINNDLSALFDQTEGHRPISFELGIDWSDPTTVEHLSLRLPYAEPSPEVSDSSIVAEEAQPEGERTRVEYCQNWTPVNDQYVYMRIMELLRQNDGDARSAFHDIRNERNQPQNCCNLNHTAIEHYLDFRAKVSSGEQSSSYSGLETVAEAVARSVTTPVERLTGWGRAGNCPPSPNSEGVIDWEARGIRDGQRDFETIPQQGRGTENILEDISIEELLEILERNTTRPASPYRRTCGPESGGLE